jgi:hypothetical protein
LRLKGHYLVSVGTMDTILVHACEVFRLAIMASAAAIVVSHNHPFGDPTPSEEDIKVTRDLIRAEQLLFTVRVVRVFRGSKRLRGDVAAEMRAIELDALHGGIGCGLGGA